MNLTAAEHHQRLLALLREKSVKTGEFELASGKVSDFYVDVRQTSLHSEGAWHIASLILARIHPEVCAIGGMTMGADPLTTSTSVVSQLNGKPLHGFLIRKEPKDHGTQHYVEGTANLEPGMGVAVLEDTTTTGGSLIKAIKRAEAAGLNVVQCITIVDRQEGAEKALTDAGYTLEALTTRSELLG